MLEQPLIVCDDRIPFLRGVFEPYAQVRYLPGSAISASDVREADALIVRTRTRCDKSLLEGSKLRIIATATIGSDHIDKQWCESAGIRIATAAGCNASSVAQYVMSVLALWHKSSGLEFKGTVLGVIGCGNVGGRVVEKARLLGMDTLVLDPPKGMTEVTMEELLRCSDIVTIHVPLDSDTRGMIGTEALSLMKPGALLINSSRGEVVSTDALKTALKSGRLKDAAIDVWENEPDIDLELLRMISVATPHIAGYSADGKAVGTMMSVRAVANFLGIHQLKDWKVETLPEPPCPANFVPRGDTLQDQMSDMLLYSYPLEEDVQRFKAAPSRFEELRNNYWTRREYQAFCPSAGDNNTDLIIFAKGIGYNV